MADNNKGIYFQDFATPPPPPPKPQQAAMTTLPNAAAAPYKPMPAVTPTTEASVMVGTQPGARGELPIEQGGMTAEEWQAFQAAEVSKFGYAPGYWEDPLRVARYYNLITSGTEGAALPSWLDQEAVKSAYNYMSYRNGGKPWWEWGVLPQDDPGRELLQQMATPPQEALWSTEQHWGEQAPQPGGANGEGEGVRRTPQQTDNVGVMTTDWTKLPGWQKVAATFMTNPYVQAAGTMLPMSIAGGLAGAAAGPVGMLVGAATPMVAGMGLAFAGDPASYDKMRAQGYGDLADKLQKTADWALKALNIPAEELEKIIGTAGQLGGAAIDPKDYGTLQEMLDNLPAVYEASRLTYETTAAQIPAIGNIPAGVEWLIDMARTGKTDVVFAGPGQVHVLGQALPQNVDKYTQVALQDAWKRIAGGEAAEQVIQEVQEKYAFSGAFTDLIFQMGADPLNVVPIVERKAVGALADVTGNPTLKLASQIAEGEGVIGTTRVYGELLRSGLGPEVKNLNPLQLKIAGLTSEGIIKNLQPSGQGLAAIAKQGVGKVAEQPFNPLIWAKTLAELTPESRARTMLAMAQENISVALDAAKGDPIKQAQIIETWIRNTPEEALSAAKVVGTPEGMTVRQAMAGFQGKVNEMRASWELGSTKRGLLLRMSSALGESPAKVLEMIRTGSAEAVYKRLITAAEGMGEAGKAILNDKSFNAKAIKDVGKWFNGNPWHPDQFQAYMHNALLDHIADWSVKAYGVKPGSGWENFTGGMKSLQSLLLLGMNPAYLVNNVVNNQVMRAVHGVWGYVSDAEITRFFDDFGIRPYRLESGMGAADVGFDIQSKPGTKEGYEAGIQEGIGQAELRIRDARQGGPLAKFKDAASRVASVGVISNLAQVAERADSAQSMYRGIKGAWYRLWNQGAAIPDMPPELHRALAEVDPRLVGALYRAVEGAKNPGEIDAAIQQVMGGMETRGGDGGEGASLAPQRTIEGYYADIAAEIGMDVGNLREMMDTTGAGKLINDMLSQGMSVRDAVAETERQMRTRMDENLAKDLVTRATEAEAKVQAEGFSAALGIFADMQLKLEQVWVRHFAEWQRTYELAYAEGVGYMERRKLIGERAEQSRVEWEAHKAWEQATWAGVLKGMGFSEGGKLSKDAVQFGKEIKMLDDAWNKFFVERDKKIRQFFDGKWPDATSRAEAWRALQEEIAVMYTHYSNVEDGFMQKQGELFVSMFEKQFGKDRAKGAAAWWDKTNQLAAQRRNIMGDFRYMMNGGDYSDLTNTRVIEFAASQRTADKIELWNNFLREVYLPVIGEYIQAGMDGAYAMYQDASGQPWAESGRMQVDAVADYNAKTGQVAEVTSDREAMLKAVEASSDQVTLIDEVGKSYVETERIRTHVDENGNLNVAMGDGFGNIPIDTVVQVRDGNGAVIWEDAARAAEITKKAREKAKVDKAKRKTYRDEINSTTMGPRAEWVKNFPEMDPRVVEAFSDVFATEAGILLDTLPPGDSTIYYVEGDGPNDILRKSANPNWYSEMYKEYEAEGKSLSKETVMNALKRIINDEGQDAIRENEQTIIRIKKLILDNLKQRNDPVYRAFYEDDIPNALSRGNLEEARWQFKQLFEAEYAGENTAEDWAMLTGSQENFDMLVEDYFTNVLTANPEVKAARSLAKDAEDVGSGVREDEQALQEIMDTLQGKPVTLENKPEVIPEVEAWDIREAIVNPNKFVTFIQGIIPEDFNGVVGLRGLYPDENIGVLKPSAIWEDGNRTEDKLDGTSTVIVSGDWSIDPFVVISGNIKKYAKKAFTYGDEKRIGLVIGDYGYGGEDAGELIISNAQVIYVWDIEPEGIKAAPTTEAAITPPEVPVSVEGPVQPIEAASRVGDIPGRIEADAGMVSETEGGEIMPSAAAVEASKAQPGKFTVLKLPQAMTVNKIPVVGMVMRDGQFVAYVPDRFSSLREFDLSDGRKGRLLGLDKSGAFVYEVDGEIKQVPLDAYEQAVGPMAPGTMDATAGPMYYSQMMEDGVADHLRPALDAIRRTGDVRGAAPLRETGGIEGERRSPQLATQINAWANQVKTEMPKVKLASIRQGEARRDLALLNYSKRYGFDNLLGGVFPYQFFYTHSMANWAMRVLDRPGWASQYARLRQFQDRYQEEQYPTRMKNKTWIPAPWLPEWAGGGVWVDPLQKLFPFSDFLRPYDRIMSNRNRDLRSAEFALARRVESGTISAKDAMEAWNTQKGAVWESVMNEVKADSDSDDPVSLMELFISPALYMTMGTRIMQGKPEKIGNLPWTRTIRAISAATGLNAASILDVEGKIRDKAGVSQYGEFGEYYIDRQLANMAAEGKYTTEEVLQEMIDREGPAYDEAIQRIQQEQMMYVSGAPALYAGRQALKGEAGIGDVLQSLVMGWLPQSLLPDGELKQRNLKTQWDAARDAYNAGDKTAYQAFFDEHPEYQARLSMSEAPEERLRSFLIDSIWSKWEETPALEQKAIEEQLGPVFQDNFMNKETRDYASIPVETLAWWTRALGGTTPKSAPQAGANEKAMELPDELATASYQQFVDERKSMFGSEIFTLLTEYYDADDTGKQAMENQYPQILEYQQWHDSFLATHPEIIPYAIGEDNKLAGVDPQIAAMVYQYRAERGRLFPGIFALQNAYYDLAKSSRAKFRRDNPMLTAYWDWKEQMQTQYPEIVPYVTSTTSNAQAVLGKDYNPGATVQKYAQANPQDFDPLLTRALMAHYLLKTPLSKGAMEEVRRIWVKLGSPGGSLEDFIDTDVAMMMGQ